MCFVRAVAHSNEPMAAAAAAASIQFVARLLLVAVVVQPRHCYSNVEQQVHHHHHHHHVYFQVDLPLAALVAGRDERPIERAAATKVVSIGGARRSNGAAAGADAARPGPARLWIASAPPNKSAHTFRQFSANALYK